MSTVFQRIWSKIYVVLGVTDTTKQQRMIQDLLGIITSEIFEALHRRLPEAQKAEFAQTQSKFSAVSQIEPDQIESSRAFFQQHLGDQVIREAGETATQKVLAEYIAGITRRATPQQKQKVSLLLEKLASFPRARLSI